MKPIIYIACCVFMVSYPLRAEYATLTEIPAQVFAEGSNTDIETLWIKDFDLKKAVKELYHTPNLIYHQGSIAEHPQNTFENYWKARKKEWKAVQFQQNGDVSLVFIGKTFETDIKKNIEIYHFKEENYQQVWSEYGNLIGYHIHPYTKEIILIQHKYPCCESASHNIFRVRLINGDIHAKKRFFVGRDKGDMVGPFFPKVAEHDKSFHKLKKITTLRWSPAVVDSHAFENRSHTNEIIKYDEGSSYKILARQDEWVFVLMYSGIMEGQSAVINYMNFKYTPVYGWFKP